MLKFEPNKIKAILIGISEFPCSKGEYKPIPQAENNINRLRNILINKNIIGVPEDNIKPLINEGTQKIREAIADIEDFKSDDILLLYYVTHGMTPRGRYQLAAHNSTPKRNANKTLISYNDDIKIHLQRCKAKYKIVIIDSCFSGKATELSSEKVKSLLSLPKSNAKAHFILASSPADGITSFSKEADYTPFTGDLCRILEEGIGTKSAQRHLELDDIYETLEERSKDQKDHHLYYEPTKNSSLLRGDLLFALNRSFNSRIKNEVEIPLDAQKIYRSILRMEKQKNQLELKIKLNDINQKLLGRYETYLLIENAPHRAEIETKLSNLQKTLKPNELGSLIPKDEITPESSLIRNPRKEPKVKPVTWAISKIKFSKNQKKGIGLFLLLLSLGFSQLCNTVIDNLFSTKEVPGIGAFFVNKNSVEDKSKDTLSNEDVVENEDIVSVIDMDKDIVEEEGNPTVSDNTRYEDPIGDENRPMIVSFSSTPTNKYKNYRIEVLMEDTEKYITYKDGLNLNEIKELKMFFDEPSEEIDSIMLKEFPLELPSSIFLVDSLTQTSIEYAIHKKSFDYFPFKIKVQKQNISSKTNISFIIPYRIWMKNGTTLDEEIYFKVSPSKIDNSN